MQAGPVPPRHVHHPAQAQPAASRAGDMPTPARAGGWGEGPMAPQGALMLGPDTWEQKDVLALADELDLEGVGAGPRISTAAAPRGPEQVRKHGLHEGHQRAGTSICMAARPDLSRCRGRLLVGCFREAVAVRPVRGQTIQNQCQIGYARCDFEAARTVVAP